MIDGFVLVQVVSSRVKHIWWINIIYINNQKIVGATKATNVEMVFVRINC